MSKIVGVTVGTPLSLSRIKEEVVPIAEQKVIEHEDNKNNPHEVTAKQIGLDNVDNTADIDKPVSNAQAEAIMTAKNEAIQAANTAAGNAQAAADNHAANKENPHGVTPAQIGAQVQHWNKVITLSAANWSGNSQSVVVAEIGKDDTIISTPSAQSYELYAQHGIKLTSQSAGILTYTCEDAPDKDVSIDITCFGSAGSAGTGGGSGGGSGKDGISPVAKVTQTAYGAEISITDANGTTTATVNHGKSVKGDKGNGIAGVGYDLDEDGKVVGIRFEMDDGQTAEYEIVHGEDYILTDADKNELAELVADMVDVPDYEDIDLSDYAKKNELPTKVSQLQNDKGYATEQFVKDGYQPKGNYLTEHQDISGKLDASALPEAVNDALAQAKASGEFDGTSVTIHSVSESQVDGEYNTIYFSDGTELSVKNGSKGSRGTSVTVTSVSESTTDGGSNVVTFSDGKTLTVKNGRQGSPGDPGYTPQKYVDYWTDVEKAAIVAEVIDSVKIEYPEAHVIYGDVDENNVITLRGELADGTYTLKYEDEDGKVTEIGTLVQDANAPNYTNQIPISTDTDGSVFNGTGYQTATRISASSGGISSLSNPNAATPAFSTGFIPVKNGDVIELKNCWMDTANLADDKSPYGHRTWALVVAFYNSSKTLISAEAWSNDNGHTTITPVIEADGKIHKFTVTKSDVAFMRINLAANNPAEAILTVNEEIE